MTCRSNGAKLKEPKEKEKNMIKRVSILGVSSALAIFLAACGSSTNPGTGGSGGIYGASATATPTAASTASAPAAATTVTVRQNMGLGPILTNGSGRTLYQFLPEKGGKIVCTGACLTAWPAALSSSAVAGAGVTGRLALITRPEGGQQLTYNTWPLYYFSGDTGPDQTKGQGLVGFGGKWLVATPSLQP
jgi:predicted lipoprotein with Yx(FWY)xxD motif